MWASDFCPPVKRRGKIGKYSTVDFYISYGPNRWYNIGGAVLCVGHWNGGYIRNFPLLPFGVPIAPTGTVVDLSSVLDKFVFVFR